MYLNLRYAVALTAVVACWLGIVKNSISENKNLRESEVPEIVISAERMPYPKSKVASSVTVINAAEIEQSQKTTVFEVLRGVPGLDVVQSGGPGGNVSVFMRGANSEHTLVIVDGIEANDPISPTRAFDFANFSVDNIEKIEIIRGPQSVLYGSDAIGGVILITTKQGQGEKTSSITVEGGSFGSFSERGQVSGSTDTTNYSFAASQQNRDGFSSAGQQFGNSEDDGYRATNVSALVSNKLTDNIESSFNLRYTNARSELDNFGGAFGDDPNRVLTDNQLLSRAQLKANFLDNKLTQKIGYTFTNQWYDDNNPINSADSLDSLFSNYTGKQRKFDFQNSYSVNDSLDFVAGYENETETGSSSTLSNSSFGPYSDILDDRSVTTNGYYLQAKHVYEDLLVSTFGGRVDSHSLFGTQETWKAGPALLLGYTKLSATAGTGYKAPSIFQLYSSFGNQNLRPEESFGWDIGVEQTFGKNKSTVGITYFNNDFDNLITFNPSTFVSENIANAKSQGIEVYTSYQILNSIKLDAAYTFTDTEDKNTGKELLRRARNKGRIAIRFDASEKLELGTEILFNGQRLDNDFSTFPAADVDLAGYSLVNLTSRYRLNDMISIFGRIDNLLDKRYEEVKGFGVPGASAFGGVKFDL
jgi:vitamin B12 transporter